VFYIKKYAPLKVNAYFSSRVSTMKTLKSKYKSSLTYKHLNDCMRVASTKYTTNYNKLAGADSVEYHINFVTWFG
jgi:hypothetical protein